LIELFGDYNDKPQKNETLKQDILN